jgi:hypothetical protein
MAAKAMIIITGDAFFRAGIVMVFFLECSAKVVLPWN